MTTVFTLNPIKLNIISTKNTIKKTLIFVGIVPKDVKHELKKIESSNKYNLSNRSLSKFYGKNWDIKLGIKKIIKCGNEIFGGDEFMFDDDEKDDEINDDEKDDEINDDEINDDEIEISKNIEKDKESVKDSDTAVNITLNELDILSNEPDIYIADTYEKTTQITKTEKNIKIQFIFSDPLVSIYPEDKVIEFKEKIYITTNIPIYRQHIWYTYNGRVYPLTYSIYNNDHLVYINVQNMITNLNDEKKEQYTIEGLPINNKYYQNKSFIKVVANDSFSILDDYYHNYGITEYNMLDLNDFIIPARTSLKSIVSEQFQLELIYYGFIILYWPMLSLEAFSDYIKSEQNIQKFYPDLHKPIGEVTQIYKLEKKIMDEKIDLMTNPHKKTALKKIRDTMTNSITESIISVIKYHDVNDNNIYIRNLFDIFTLSDKVISCKCLIQHNNKRYFLHKTYKSAPQIKDIVSVNSIMFKIKVDATLKTISLIINKNGNYVIKSSWNEEDQHDFDDVFNICKTLTKPIIDKINTFGSFVFVHKKLIPTMDKNNSKFTEIGMRVFYKKSFSQHQFAMLKDLLEDFRKAGIMKTKITEKNVAEYYFSKGMYQFNVNRIEKLININNYYDYMTNGIVKQKWFTIFEKTRITKVHHRFSDIKIEIMGIKEKEFFTFYNFILTLFYLYDQQCASKSSKCNTKTITERALKRTLHNLKEQDPVLYNFKKLYKTENIYSKICQKPYQPLLLNKQGYDDLSKDYKKNAVKYWNFTTQKDAYYTCPNKKFPYLKFIIKKHPKDYCIPCCVKTNIHDTVIDAKKVIYDICLKEHKYVKEEKTITLGSRYIMTYGKDIEPGRLSKLPEHSLEPLFYETFSIQSQGIDKECDFDDGFYLYGIDQHYKSVNNVGILNILVHASETTVQDFINKLINLIKTTPNKFRVILNGNIGKYFLTTKDFTDALYTNFVGISTNLIESDPSSINNVDKIPWNDIFINLAYLFLNINMIYFREKKHEDVKLILPSYITTKDQFLSNTYTNIIILQKGNKIYPIYRLNTAVFFKVKIISKKMFSFNDDIITIIGRVAEIQFSENIKNNVSNGITYTIMKKFIDENNYTLHKLFVNNSNMCYYCHIKSKSGENLFVPIELSHYMESDKITITYDMFLRTKSRMSIHMLMGFIKKLNHWIAIKSEKAGMIYKDMDKSLPLESRVQPIYPFITIENWYAMGSIDSKITPNSNVIGFISNNINYYFNNIKLNQVLKIQKKPVMQLFYDPDDINKSIFTKTPNMVDARCKLSGKSIYKNNLYKLVLLEFIHVFNNQKNTKIRQKIKSKLLGNLNKDFDELLDQVCKIVPDPDDYAKIKTHICEFVNIHHSKNLLFQEIDVSFYNFDRMMFECIKKLPKEKIYKELENISQKFIMFGDISKVSNFEFPNMYISCQEKNKSQMNYCKNNKLIIDKVQYKKILEIITADILNPVKEKWLFSSAMTDKVISLLKFTKRPDEAITVEVVE